MTYVCYYTIEYDCHNQYYSNYKNIHERESHYGTGNTAEEALENMKTAFADMRAAYERSGWHTEDFKDAFMGEKDGNKNYYYGIRVRQVDSVPIRTAPSPSKRTAETISNRTADVPKELSPKEKAFLADLAELCKKFGMLEESC